MTTKNQELSLKAVKRIAFEYNQELCDKLEIKLENLHVVGENSVAFDIKQKFVSESDTNYHDSNVDEIYDFIKSILETFERVRISQDFDVDDFNVFFRYHISCGIVKIGYREIPEEE